MEVPVSRLSLAVFALAFIPAAALADVPLAESKPAKSADVKTATFTAPAGPVVYGDMPPGYQYYGAKLRWQLWWDEHNCAPDGCPKPIGCGNFWTEKKFIFGSCRQFFGTAQSSVGHGYETDVRHK
jgi:hypothetical protein